MSNIDKLPPIAAVRHNVDHSVVLVKRGEQGYFPAPDIKDPEAWNKAAGVTNQQAAAMFMGSMFGFHTPGADPDRYDEARARDTAYRGSKH